MKRYIAILLLAIATPALALPAFLRDCRQSRSITQQVIWVGTYEVNGYEFERIFTHYCPAVIQVQ